MTPQTSQIPEAVLDRRQKIVELMMEAEPLLRSGRLSVHIRGQLVTAGHPAELVDAALEALLTDPSAVLAPSDALNAAVWLTTPPPQPNAVLPELCDIGDKVALIGGAKTRKTFALLQWSLCAASGAAFLRWRVAEPLRVLFLNFELRPHHLHRRLHRMAETLGITADAIGDRLVFRNLRGSKFELPRVEDWATEHEAQVVFIDPLYRCHDGDENLAKDVKPVLRSFDVLAERCNALVVYSHHDAKGSPGDRDTRDRGAGSNVLARDYDAAITLTEHQDEPDSLVVKTLLRNYPPQPDFTIMFHDGAFVDTDLPAVARTSTRPSKYAKAIRELRTQEPNLSRRQAAERIGCSVGTIETWWNK